jgi:hypothetical protein
MITLFMLLLVLAIVMFLLSAFHVPGPIVWGWLGAAFATLAFVIR